MIVYHLISIDDTYIIALQSCVLLVYLLYEYCACSSLLFACLLNFFFVSSAVGMKKNVRSGTNEDNTQCTPSLIPMHEVFSAARDDHIQSQVAEQIVLRARLSRTDSVTGYIGREYVPMYVRNTLFEVNGTSDGGDQTFENMGKDSRYSGQMGRTMQSLEPSKHEQKNLKKKFKQSNQLARGVETVQASDKKSLPNVKSTTPAPLAEKKVAKIRF